MLKMMEKWRKKKENDENKKEKWRI